MQTDVEKPAEVAPKQRFFPCIGRISSAFRALTDDENGSLSLLMALAAVPVFGMIAVGMDSVNRSATVGDIQSALEEACLRADSSFFEHAPATDRKNAAEAVLTKRLAALPAFANVTSSASVIGEDVQVAAAGKIEPTIGAFTSYSDVAIDLSRTCAKRDTSPKPGDLVFEETFENPVVNRLGGFWVYPDFGPWALTQGSGVRLLNKNLLAPEDPPAAEGTQYAELDSNSLFGGLFAPTSNSAITVTLFLEPGAYRLRYWYRSRPIPFGPPDPNDTAIGVYFAGEFASPFSNQVDYATNQVAWDQREFFLPVSVSGWYQLTFRAEGAANYLGGLIDHVELHYASTSTMATAME